jgi:molecular chaperone GrpE (heat shock protein)
MTPETPIKFHHLVNAAGLLRDSPHATTIKAGIQQQHNRIAQLERQIVDERAQMKIMAQDLQGQRGEIERALAALDDAKNVKFAQRILRGVLDYRNAQREPRKNSPPAA